MPSSPRFSLPYPISLFSSTFLWNVGSSKQGDLVAGRFHIPVGIQVKRYRNNVQRPDIDRFIGALSGRFAEGMFMTTAEARRLPNIWRSHKLLFQA